MAFIWIRDDFSSHPKIVQLTDSELRTWLKILCWAARFKTAGIVPETIKTEVSGATPKTIKKFASLELLDSHENGWKIHDWDEYNGTGKQREQARMRKREQRAKAGQERDTEWDNVTAMSRKMSRSLPRGRASDRAEFGEKQDVRSVGVARNELPPTSESNGNGHQAEQPSITARYEKIPINIKGKR